MYRQYLSANIAQNLYWLGRHIKRLELEMIAIDETFMEVIDINRDAGKEFFSLLGVELEYNNVSEYLEEAVFGDHVCNLYLVIQHVRENAIVARNYLPHEAFAAIIELFELFNAHEHNKLKKIDYNFIDKVLNVILRIWGALDQFLDRQNSYDFIHFGDLVEKVDLSLRLDKQTEFTLLLIDDIDEIGLRLNSEYEKEKLSGLKPSKLLDKVNTKINMVITDTI